MNIAVYHNLPSGGGKRALYEQVRRLAARHTVDVYTLSCAEHDFCDLRPYVRAYYVEPFGPGRLYKHPLGRLNQGVRVLDLRRLDRQQRALAARIDSVGFDAAAYDAVLVANCQFAAAPPLLRYLHTPAVYYCQEPPRQLYEPDVARSDQELTALQRTLNLIDPLPGWYRRTLGRTDRAGTRAASLVLVNSDYSRETLYRTYGLFAGVNYLGVDTDLFRSHGLAREDFVLSVGALNPRKGYEFLLRSLAVMDPAQRSPLVIVSNFEGPGEREYLEGLANDLGVSLTLRTLVRDDELVSVYNRAALVLYAPIMEPFGFVPLEAMACGAPVVGIREAGVRESVADGVTGVLTERDPRAFAAAVQSLLADTDRRQKLAEHCRPYVLARWTWERSVAELESYLAQAAAMDRP
ncbi:MAG: glycosyltransferase family 4 protein [Anaerolineae bacterium]